MPAITLGQRFPTLQTFKDALRDWAVEKNFTPHILDSDRTRVRVGCRSAPDCPFKIRVNFNTKLGFARVTTLEDSHTCAANAGQLVSQNIKRAEIAKVAFLVKAVPQLLEVSKETPVSRIVEAVEKKYGQKIADRQAQKVKRALCTRPCRHCHQFGHSGRNCPLDLAQTNGDEANSENGEADNSPGNDVPGSTSHCPVCSQTGHNRSDCPGAASSEAPNQEASLIEEQLNIAAYAPALPPYPQRGNNFPLDPRIEQNEPAQPLPPQVSVLGGSLPPNRPLGGPSGLNHSLQPGPSSQQRHLQPTPNIPMVRSASNQTTSQNPRLEAARMMQQAARLMQEAARLNFEAARLTASVVD